MKTEYLIPINTKNGIAKTEQAFTHLLMANANLKIEREKIKFKNFSFEYKLQSNPIDKSDIVCYHLTIKNTINNYDFNPDSEEVKVYLELLKSIKTTILKTTSDFEILWDDVSFCCSQKAYPQIYEIENLMRKLLTKFMLVNVGTKWEKENIPTKIGKSKNQGKEINIGNSLLYQLDFIELSTFLFDPYSTKNIIEDLKPYIVRKDESIFQILDQYIPKSNWARYFNNVISAEDEHIKKKWEELYKLRCKVAHNNLFTVDELDRVETLIKEIKPYIENAIEELDRINVSDSDKEIISENLAKNGNEEIGEFLEIYNELYNILLREYYKLKINKEKYQKRVSYKKMIHELWENGKIDEIDVKRLNYIIYKRNNLVHGVEEINKDEMDKIIHEMIEYIFLYKTLDIEGCENYEND